MQAPRFTSVIPAVILSVVVGVLSSGGVAAAASPMTCDRELAIELTPDVPDPRDDGFLSSLLGNQVDYQLIFLKRIDDDFDVLLELTGPGPEYRCRDVIQAMRKDGRVISIRVRNGLLRASSG